MTMSRWAAAAALAVPLLAAALPATRSGVPRGAPEDQELWRTTQAAQDSAFLERHIADQLLARIERAGYHDRLDARVEAGGEAAARAGELKRRLASAQAQARAALAAPGEGADMHSGCRRLLQSLAGSMMAPVGSPVAAELPRLRGEARACRDRLVAQVKPVADANAALRAALGEIDAVLPPATVGASATEAR
jgi:hypothetical protein